MISPGPWLVTKAARVIDRNRVVLTEDSMKLVAVCPEMWDLTRAVASGAPMTEQARALVARVENAPWNLAP